MPPTDLERDIAEIKDGKSSSQLYADLQHDHRDHAKLQSALESSGKNNMEPINPFQNAA